MAKNVEWVKITTDMFDNRKIKHLRKLPDGNSIVLIWVMLLTMAGRCNAGGMIFLTENIPYTPKMLSDELGFELSTIQLALEALERLNMISRNEDMLFISGWEEHQNIEGLDRIREQTKKRVADHRARKKQLLLLEGSTCAYCGKAADTIDHIIPRSKNGSDDESNIVPCCKSCNSSKKDKSLVDFLNDSFYYSYEGVDHDRVRSNPKLMKHVRWDSVSGRYSNVTVTDSNAAEEEREEDIEIDNNSQKENEQKKKSSSDDGDAPPDVSPASGTDARPKKEEKVFDKDSDAYQAASFLARQKEKHYPDLKPPEETDLQRWAADFDKCNRIDKRSWDDISDVLRFSQKNAFWRKNILSGKKFREKYERLLIEMTEENRKNGKR